VKRRKLGLILLIGGNVFMLGLAAILWFEFYLPASRTNGEYTELSKIAKEAMIYDQPHDEIPNKIQRKMGAAVDKSGVGEDDLAYFVLPYRRSVLFASRLLLVAKFDDTGKCEQACVEMQTVGF